MTQEKLARINQLSRKSKTLDGLSPEEIVERDDLRNEYIASVRNNLTSQLENTYLVNEDGTTSKLEKK